MGCFRMDEENQLDQSTEIAEETGEAGKVLERNAPEPPQSRAALVKALCETVRLAKAHWKDVFDAMDRDSRFCAGHMWNEETKAHLFNDGLDDRYIANITLRHVQQKVASLYAKNPKAVARRRQKMLSTVWDGSMA
ncbi:MAG: hypothetical protein N2444_04920, partial [Methylocystis sp.]|nr:hypothetical protein [Methylocystis sp.]